MTRYDVVIVGGGPAGATTAAAAAQSGLSTLVIERTEFPRDKVCGDCVNPGVWQALGRIGAIRAIESLPAAQLRWIEFTNIAGRSIRFQLPDRAKGEWGIRRKHFDEALIKHAMSTGAAVQFGEPVIRVQRDSDWIVSTHHGTYRSRFLVAADGRNSTVARLLNHFPRTGSDRIALQTHFELQAEPHISLEFNPFGYLGLATIGENLTNLCLVCPPNKAELFKRFASEKFGLPETHRWLTITPLSRSPILSDSSGLLYVGDSARVVEPFTGEGILYALCTGIAAADAIRDGIKRSVDASVLYRRAFPGIYRNRLWINQLARWSVLYPKISSAVLDLLRFFPEPLKYLTSRVVVGEK
jgi:flavin-dependent dehydrogenase